MNWRGSDGQRNRGGSARRAVDDGLSGMVGSRVWLFAVNHQRWW